MNVCKLTFYTSCLFAISISNLPAQIISTVAGNGYGAGLNRGGYSGNGGKATLAELHGPSSVAFDTAGNYYIVDQYNDVIRKVNDSGIITTIAGIADSGAYSGDGGPAILAKLHLPRTIVLDSAGNLYFTDEENNRVRRIDAHTGKISTVAGDSSQGYNGDGILGTDAELYNPTAVAIDKQGNLYVADEGNNRIREVDTTGIITTVAGNGSQGFSGDGGLATNAQLDSPFGITLDDTGNIYIADAGNECVRKISKKTGIINTIAGMAGVPGFAGDNGPATSAEFGVTTFAGIVVAGVEGISFDAAGAMYIADGTNACIRKVNSSGIISTLAGIGGAPGYAGNGGLATFAKLDIPYQVTFDSHGNMYIPDWYNNVIRKVTNVGGFLGVTNKKEEPDYISVFPNPAKDYTTVEFAHAGKPTEEIVSLYTIQGQLLFSQSYCSQNNVILNVSGYSDGIYILRVTEEDGTTVIKKVEIQK